MTENRREDWVSELGRVERTHQNLSDRELVLVIGAMIEAALADLLCKRLHGPTKDIVGLTNRMQLEQMMKYAWAVGVISEKQFRLLDAFKSIRNDMAHKINVNLLAEAKTDSLRTLYNLLDPFVKAHGREGLGTWKDIKKNMTTDVAMCRLLLRSFQHVLEEEFKKTRMVCSEIASLCGDAGRPD